MVIDGIALNVIINTLLTLLAYVRAEYERVQRISQKLAKWPGMLQKIHAVSHDAEKRQMNGDSAVYLWLADLREVAYDMEDVLDGLAAEARKKALKLPGVLSIQQMKGEVDEIDSRLGEIFMQVSLLHLNENSELQSSSSHGRSSSNVQVPTSLPEQVFFGREKEMEELILRLTGIDEDDDHVANYTVIPIVGMGGVGKTALAQQLYNHKEVREAFVLRAWAHVSDDFDSIAITKSILETVAPSGYYEGKDLNWLQVTLMGQLSQKKFLIVLDDVWNENYSELNSLLNPFHSGSRGSRVLLTTRSLKVATRVGDPTMLSFLDADQCLPVLAHHAIGKENFKTRPHLMEVAAQLAKKCKGLPLAAKTIGGLLRAEDSFQKWREILDQGIWNSDRETNSIPAVLKLSYAHLPVHLKRCFAACALFPKGYVFDPEELVRLWIAHGLLPEVTSKTYREVGIDYFRELEARSFFQRASKETPWFSMHDLINDLAKSVVGDAYFSSHECSNLAHEDSLGKARHGSIVMGKWEKLSPSRLDVYRSMKKLRTFVPFQISPHYGPNVFVSNKAMQNLLTGLKCLRELSLRYFRITEVPNEIGELKLLRSLDFSYTLIAVLPEKICYLVNLKILLVRGCQSLAALPANIHRLTNLLHLDICYCNIKEMPSRIGELANLEILSKFVVGKKAGQELKELRRFPLLQRELHIRDLHKVEQVADATIADLREKHGLTILGLSWSSEYEIPLDHGHQLKLLELLQPPKEIQQLKIMDYGGTRLPSWCGTPFIDNITIVKLVNCRYIECLPPFGQLPSLKQLYLDGLYGVRKIGAEFYGNGRPFQSLRALFFRNMVAWEEWSFCEGFKDEQPFSCLRELVVQNCPKLNKGLPRRLDSLAELTISDCPLLVMSEATFSLPSLLNFRFENSNVGLLASFVDITSLAKFTITRVQPLPFFDRRFVASWVALEKLEIQDCDHLVRLSDDICCLVSLEGCANLSDFNSARLPPNLTSLSIFSCKNLQFLPMELMIPREPLSCQLVGINLDGRSNAMLETCHLTELTLKDCQSIEPSQFHHMTLPPTLKNLQIERCKGLESLAFLVADVHHSQSLQELRIRSCENFKRLPDKLPHLINLTSLEVDDCRDLELECFPPLPCNLSAFNLSKCPKVKSLPLSMQNLTSLKKLVIWSSTSITCLPKGGLPPNLESLSIGYCKKLTTPLPEWGLHGLTALRTLEIGGGMECVDGMVCFPSADRVAWARLLPSSLVNLYIGGMASVKMLVGGLRTHLASLEVLLVKHCPKLRYLPEDGLPTSLVRLWIRQCELLKERCSEPKGCYWPVIQLIPDVSFEEKLKFTEALPPPDCL